VRRICKKASFESGVKKVMNGDSGDDGRDEPAWVGGNEADGMKQEVDSKEDRVMHIEMNDQ